MSLRPRTNQDNRRRFAAANLKRCPLCGAVNTQQNHQCFACGWHGKFDQDPAIVQEGLNQLMDRCPELTNGASLEEPKKPSLWRRILNKFRRKVDIWA
ncbi:MAG: hypothetical protein BGO01_03900 [Armatimonadetes bacterium 55-13]|nr:hypothetical protein [Armatimonadota bacterium]OJU63293.1 MAG: hypothetical protein BGO01_03900 [Armatimonadetes bacterium 55-13]